MPRKKARRQKNSSLPFGKRLILNKWILSLFGKDCFDHLAKPLKKADLEGFDENNVTRFYHELVTGFDENNVFLTADDLLRYDENIVRYWKKITEKRNHSGHVLYPKYFQYLALLFSEIYLDRYFRDRKGLLNSLNAYVARFLHDHPDFTFKPFRLEDLNKLAFWMATGSGKTLLMHINLLQYLHYLKLYGNPRELNQIILLTPNEGLSHQHLSEFRLSGIKATLFRKEHRFTGYLLKTVQIIDIHKLREDSGDKTISVDAFEGNNLVLVDEGHRGTSGGKGSVWLERRDKLCEKGFSFEYSATFGQAVKGDKKLEDLYSRCIIFDYSYRYFYKDGYGKDYRILNLEDDSDEVVRKKYLTAGLLTFYQQLRLYLDKKERFRPYLLSKPLWVFVGGSVNAVRTQNKRKVSDVLDILLFLADFLRDRSGSIEIIQQLLTGQSGLLDKKGHEIFSNFFNYLNTLNLSAEEVYHNILNTIFNTQSPGSLYLEYLKDTEGEIALKVGDNEPFGVINVGDPKNLLKLCEKYPDLVVTEKIISGSLFYNLHDDDSKVNILIGSRKFSEGWNSWRVSTMGLMNIGKKEGAQIIQLFGRGVRLKGKDYCLKRSRCLEDISHPKYIEFLETLNVFGIRADYMRQFKEYLEEEGLPTNEDCMEFILPVVKNLNSSRPLKIIKVKEGIDFRRDGPRPCFGELSEYIRRYKVVVNWYPRLQSLESGVKITQKQRAEKDLCWFEEKHIVFLDIDKIYFELQEYKAERGWYNVRIDLDKIPILLMDKSWYELYIPKEEMELKKFEQVRRWQEIAVALLKKYLDRHYTYCKRKYEDDNLEVHELKPDDPNFFKEYKIYVQASREDIVIKLKELKDLIQSGKFKKDFSFENILAITFEPHLYQPLLYIRGDFIEVKPVVLDAESEREFLFDLRKFYEKNRSFFQDKELYLLRNLSRRGIGFFEQGNFYPDFILWVLFPDIQHVIFIDPKGLRNVEGPSDPKIQFYRTIKEIEDKLNDPQLSLHSFIVSSTLYNSIKWWGLNKKELENCHIFFQKDDKETYIEKIFEKIKLFTTN